MNRSHTGVNSSLIVRSCRSQDLTPEGWSSNSCPSNNNLPVHTFVQKNCGYYYRYQYLKYNYKYRESEVARCRCKYYGYSVLTTGNSTPVPRFSHDTVKLYYHCTVPSAKCKVKDQNKTFLVVVRRLLCASTIVRDQKPT